MLWCRTYVVIGRLSETRKRLVCARGIRGDRGRDRGSGEYVGDTLDKVIDINNETNTLLRELNELIREHNNAWNDTLLFSE